MCKMSENKVHDMIHKMIPDQKEIQYKYELIIMKAAHQSRYLESEFDS